MDQDISVLLHERYSLLQFLALHQNDPGQFSSRWWRCRDSIRYEAGTGGIDEIENIIKLRGQLVDKDAIHKLEDLRDDHVSAQKLRQMRPSGSIQ
jgi:hypothetical protein